MTDVTSVKRMIFIFFFLGISIGLIFGTIYTIWECKVHNSKAVDLLSQCQDALDECRVGQEYKVTISGVEGWT